MNIQILRSTSREVLCQGVNTYANNVALTKIISIWEILKYWIQILRLTDYAVKIVRISIFQVSDENGRVANSLVGVVTDHQNKTACIYHTRRLKEEDILHELFHVKFPLLSEEYINLQVKKTLERTRLLKRKIG